MLNQDKLFLKLYNANLYCYKIVLHFKCNIFLIHNLSNCSGRSRNNLTLIPVAVWSCVGTNIIKAYNLYLSNYSKYELYNKR